MFSTWKAVLISPRRLVLCSLWVGLACQASAPPPRFTLATYNLENYILTATASRPAKPEASRQKICSTLVALRADVLALQEVGGLAALAALRDTLHHAGLEYPHWDLVPGWDTNIQVALLSRFPIVARRPHTDVSFLLRGRRFRATRGFLEVDIAVRPQYRLTLLAAHLKSRRESPEAAQNEIREEEARALRKLVDERLRADPGVNLVVLGDFNDVKGSPTLRILTGRGRTGLIDTRPAEANGDDRATAGSLDPRTITWTHYYGKEDTYSRVDYILLSPGLAREWDRTLTRVVAQPDWGVASDHRPVIAGFAARDE